MFGTRYSVTLRRRVTEYLVPNNTLQTSDSDWLYDDGDAFRLQAEIREILESNRLLKEKLHAAVQSMARLQRTKVTLENDIAVKESSILIDRRECIGLRKNVAIDPTRGGANFSMSLTGFWIRCDLCSTTCSNYWHHSNSILVTNVSRLHWRPFRHCILRFHSLLACLQFWVKMPIYF